MTQEVNIIELAKEVNKKIDIGNICQISEHRYMSIEERPKQVWVRYVNYDIFEEFNGKECNNIEELNTLASWGCCNECFERSSFVRDLKDNQSRPWNYWKYIF